MEKLTPMMAQYREIKKKYADCMLFFRLGDFYEMFEEDAKEGARILSLALTQRQGVPMCGVPYHSGDGYIAKLTRSGKKIAICEQLSDPKLPGIVERDVVRVITPGTTQDENILEQKKNNYVMSFVLGKTFGMAFCDVLTGEFQVAEFEDLAELKREIVRLQPKECVVSSGLELPMELKSFCEQQDIYVFSIDFFEDARELLTRHFSVKNLEGFGVEPYSQAISAAGLLFHYLRDTQKTDLKHIQNLKYYHTDEYMPVDETTLKNLEILATMRDMSREWSLLWVLDKTVTNMGGRLLRFFLTHPLRSRERIEERLNAVEEFVSQPDFLRDVQDLLKNLHDIERLLGRVSLGTGNVRDLTGLKNSLKILPELIRVLKDVKSSLLSSFRDEIVLLPELVELLEEAFVEVPPLSVREGGFVREGYDADLDEFRKFRSEGKDFIKNLQEREITRTGIQSLKVRYNQVFGYYIEISKANLDKVPPDYIRKQTLVNAERFITPELKEYEEKVLGAEEKIVQKEYEIFCQIREIVLRQISAIQKNAHVLAFLDVLCSFAFAALHYRYVKPEIAEEPGIEIEEGRHPVIERISFSQQFIPNDVQLSSEQRLLLITGPNMGGKSTYLRQVALICFMAHLGSFVPAKLARIGLIDRIFTRVGASDNLVRGQSTFMVEMQEASHILRNATEQSLVILDEIGRGTSTYDGVSIAWAMAEYLHDHVKALTLFATHYHELIAVIERLKYAKNLSVAVKENPEGIVFLYKIIEGGIDRSYGIEVARIAGLPHHVVERSQQILKELEEEVVEKGIETHLREKPKVSQDQMNLFEDEMRKHRSLHETLQQIDVNNLTPLQALEKLNELKHKINL